MRIVSLVSYAVLNKNKTKTDNDNVFLVMSVNITLVGNKTGSWNHLNAQKILVIVLNFTSFYFGLNGLRWICNFKQRPPNSKITFSAWMICIWTFPLLTFLWLCCNFYWHHNCLFHVDKRESLHPFKRKLKVVLWATLMLVFTIIKVSLQSSFILKAFPVLLFLFKE